MKQAPTGLDRLRGAEMLLSALLAAVLDKRESIDTGLVLTTYVVGLALDQHAVGGLVQSMIDHARSSQWCIIAAC